MRFERSIALAGILGGLAWSSTALAQQPINLLSPTAGGAVQATSLPPPTVLASPQTEAAQPPAPAYTSRPMLSAYTTPSYGTAVPYLETAQASISGRRYVTAGEVLEQAETSLLNDGAGSGQDTGPAAGLALLQVSLARQAVAERDQAGALEATGRALNEVQEAGREPQGVAVARAAEPAQIPASPAGAAVPPVPTITKALLPGHWQLTGWQYHWVPPETQLRPVDNRSFVVGHYVWRDGAWAWNPGHYGDE